MPGVRDHEPIVIESFNGWWKRGDPESAPSDHFIEATNIQYIASGFETRDGIDIYHTPATSIGDVRRIYSYVSNFGDSLLVLTVTPAPTTPEPTRTLGKIYHIWQDIIHPPILEIYWMEDFDAVGIAGRAYITPFKSYSLFSGETIQMGIKNEYLYVYEGAGNPARKAGGTRPIGAAMTIVDGAAGLTDTGFHLFAYVYETSSGYITAPGPGSFAGTVFTPAFTGHTLTGTNKLNISGIVGSSDPFVVKIHLVATKWIPEYNNDPLGYEFFFVPNATIDNAAGSLSMNNVEFFDSDLIDDASHLLDNFDFIPSGVALTTYHSRLVIAGEYGTTETLVGLPPGMEDNRSLARVSYPGEPEAISKVDGLLVAPMDGNPLTNCQEFRDVLYLFKKTRTYGYSDNGDEPSTWQEEVVDQAIGSPVHGVATVLASGGVNIDFLLVASWAGLVQFNGVYAHPELSWKIEDFWLKQVNDSFNRIQIVLDTINKKIWMTLPEPDQNKLLHADYTEGLDAKNIKWSVWSSYLDMSGLTMLDNRTIIIGAYQHLFGPPGPGMPDVSGLYVINPVLKHDVYYDRRVTPTVSLNWQIPDPTIRTALLGE